MKERSRVSWIWGMITSLLVSASLLALLSYRVTLAQGTGWSEPVLLSTKTYHPWFPDIAVDADGRIHVVYDTGDVPISQGEALPGVMYTVFQDDVWSEPNDLILGKAGNIFRPAIAVDRLGYLHMVHSGVWYRRAPVTAARSAASWSKHVLDDGVTYMSDVAVDSRGAIHVVYEKWVFGDEPILAGTGREIGLADIFYRRSNDGGRTWTPPLNLSNTTKVGSYRVQIKVDAHDVIHVTWDEGWDRRSLWGEPQEGMYTSSADGGQTWSDPVVFSQPENTNAQIAAASDNQGGVLVVWRSTTIDRVFYSWSTDNGITWSEPREIPGLYARSYNDTPFDAYDMDTDSAGRIHLVAVGRSRLPESRGDRVPLGVYHLMWDGESWSEIEPIAIYTEDSGFPEYPKLAISEGNQLHVVWFVRDQQFGGEHYRIFYSHAESATPRQTPAPTPTLTPTATPTTTPVPPPTTTPLPTLDPATTGLPDGLYTENDEIGQLLLASSPVIVLIGMVAAVKLGWIRRLWSILVRRW